MEPTLRQAIARIDIIQHGSSVSRGTGFLVARDLVLTALHLVADRAAPGVRLYPGRIALTFPTHTTDAAVLDGCADPRSDWILLRCETPPAEVPPIPLANSVEDRALWETYGFPDANWRDGLLLSGSIKNASGTFDGVAAYQLFSDEAAAGTGARVKGLSGGPIIVDGAAVGLLRSSLMHEGQNVAGTLYGCPISLVLEQSGDVLPPPVKRSQRGGPQVLRTGDRAIFPSSAVAEGDAILLAEFGNTTGEPIFDGTLQRALAVKLDESPYLDIISDDRVQRTLRLMGRPHDERLTEAVSREICERQSIKAMVTGSIANLGSQYVITLTAVNCQNGDSIARAQADAASKEGVLSALGTAATRLREVLGESLASIQRYDTPLPEATTSSLDALKAFSNACVLRAAGKEREAIPLLKRAIDLDPNFAESYMLLGLVHSNLGEATLTVQCFTQAYEYRRRVTERARLLITATYHSHVTGDLLELFETLTVFQQTYPKDSPAWNQLGLYYSQLGQFARAADAYREAVRLAPEFPVFLHNLAFSYIELNLIDEAKTVLEQTVALEGESTFVHRTLAQIAHVWGDDAAKQRELEWLAQNDPGSAFAFKAWVATMAGKLRSARECVAKSAELETRASRMESAASTWLSLAQMEAACGLAELARRDVATALTLASSRDVAHWAGRILAISGFDEESQPLLDRCLKEYPPTHTLAKALYIPAIRAAFDLTHGNAAAAIEALQPAEPYDAGYNSLRYMRASAYLAVDRPADAAAEFQKVIDYGHGWSLFTPIAQLGRARALGRMGDMAGSRAVYQEFFTAWKDADPELPILLAAKQEACAA